MFSWMNTNHFVAGNGAGTPADEAVLDALVDDELDDNRRREFLQRMDKEPAGWRRVALRFLQRQVERRAVRDLMGGAVARVSASPKTEGKIIRWYPALRVAAVVMLVAGLVGIFASHRGRRPAGKLGAMATSSPVNTNTVADRGSSRRHIQFFPGPASQFLGPSNASGLNPQYGGNIRRTARRVLLVPRGGNRVMAYPVAPLNAQGIPIY